MRTTGHRYADIISTRIGIIAVLGQWANTNPSGTGIFFSTGIQIIARPGILRIDATHQLVTRIRSTVIGIVAGQDFASLTGPRGTGVIGRTGVAIITRSTVELVLTTGIGLTKIARADIGIVTVKRRTRDADASLTVVSGGAGVVVITDSANGNMDAALVRVT